MPRISRRVVAWDRRRWETAWAISTSTRARVRTFAAVVSEKPMNQNCEASAPRKPAPREGRQALKLSTRAFQAYLRSDGPEAADAALKRRLGIASKRELNANADAAGRWRDLVRDFDAWMRGGGEEG